ncbi:hypothetical protein JOB18_041289 [Solea senegalensis]|uniref:Uncharacterized protein n=1 Tax=Solea senegalensis TaxID=28829 RepID=A0AAV6QXR1_SOLSE|nr:hypothetical protein JOB18_041289 [Solea senegalensis]
MLTASYTAESDHLVKTLLERHRHTINKEQEENVNHPDKSKSDVNWVSIRDSTVEVGKQQIVQYIQTWELQPCWLYSLDFLHTTEEEFHTFHHYRARFSTPTPQRPIQGTASVYFVVYMSKVKLPSLPVQVHFVVESNRLVHTPRTTVFREKWLVDVIESKTLLHGAVQPLIN